MKQLSLIIMMSWMAMAQDHQEKRDHASVRDGGPLFVMADQDHNRELTSEEWDAFLDAVIDPENFELNHERLKTYLEGQGAPAPPDPEPEGRAPTREKLNERFQARDENGDGVLTGEELPRPPRRGRDRNHARGKRKGQK